MRWLFQKIEAARAVPENLLKETVDLESVIVVIIERNGKGKLSEDTLETGIRFPPD